MVFYPCRKSRIGIDGERDFALFIRFRCRGIDGHGGSKRIFGRDAADAHFLHARVIAACGVVEVDGKQALGVDEIEEGVCIDADFRPGIACKFAQERIGCGSRTAEDADLHPIGRRLEIYPKFNDVEIGVIFYGKPGRQVDVHPDVLADVLPVDGEIAAGIGGSCLCFFCRFHDELVGLDAAGCHKADLRLGRDDFGREHFTLRDRLIDVERAGRGLALAVRLDGSDFDLVRSDAFGREIVSSAALGKRGDLGALAFPDEIHFDGHFGRGAGKIAHRDDGEFVFLSD